MPANSTDIEKPLWDAAGELRANSRRTFTRVDSAHREFALEQLEFLANIVRLYRGGQIESTQGSDELMAKHSPDGVYQDVPGLRRIASLEDIEAQGWSLNPGRYVGVAERREDGFGFAERLLELHEELELLNAETHELEQRIAGNGAQLWTARDSRRRKGCPITTIRTNRGSIWPSSTTTP